MYPKVHKLQQQLISLPSAFGTYAIHLVLPGVATGRGSHLSSDTGFQDSVTSDSVQILRPMKEFSDEEIRIFNEGDNTIGNPL